jgi:hypothetical protein
MAELKAVLDMPPEDAPKCRGMSAFQSEEWKDEKDDEKDDEQDDEIGVETREDLPESQATSRDFDAFASEFDVDMMDAALVLRMLEDLQEEEERDRQEELHRSILEERAASHFPLSSGTASRLPPIPGAGATRPLSKPPVMRSHSIGGFSFSFSDEFVRSMAQMVLVRQLETSQSRSSDFDPDARRAYTETLRKKWVKTPETREPINLMISVEKLLPHVLPNAFFKTLNSKDYTYLVHLINLKLRSVQSWKDDFLQHRAHEDWGYDPRKGRLMAPGHLSGIHSDIRPRTQSREELRIGGIRSRSSMDVRPSRSGMCVGGG